VTKKKILFLGGSLNQTSMVHAVAEELKDEYECWFTPYYCDHLLKFLDKFGLLDFSIMGGNFRRQTDAYLREHGLPIDDRGENYSYDLAVTTSDLIVQRNLRRLKLILIQEGMTDPENLMYHLVKRLRLPRYLASTSTNGLSNLYDYFCVASEGYKQHFIHKGVSPEKLVVTGIPNFDNAIAFLDNNFPFQGFVLVATSDSRETFKFDNRRAFIRRATEIAGSRQLIFKLHPNEKVERAVREILEIVPNAIVLTDGNINHMIANCEVLIAQYSSCVYIGLALGKEVHSYFDVNELRRLTPIQNGGSSARNIADVCQILLEGVEMEVRNEKVLVHAA
jgi:hypothetical protein